MSETKHDPMKLLRDVHDHLLALHRFSDDAPGHSHMERGRWDATGEVCEWCATWKKVEECLKEEL